MNSFNKMINVKPKVIKRNDDGMLIQIDNIHVRPGLNRRVEGERLKLANEGTLNYIMKGGVLPALEVEPRDEGGVWLVDGHRRHYNYLRARELGKPVDWIKIVKFEGNDVDRVARIKNSNAQLTLTDFEESLLVKDMLAFNLDAQDISDKLDIPRYKVDAYLVFIKADHAIQQLVKNDDVDIMLAVERIKKSDGNALEILQADADKAQADGKRRATKSTAIPQFSAKKSRSAVELLSTSEVYDAITDSNISCDIKLEILNILDQYRDFTQKQSDEGDAKNQLEILE